jgi:lipopolysaccharide heptosyltransferase I
MGRRFLVIRLSAIGDVVRTLPAVKGLRERYPDAYIAWLVEEKSSDILLDSPYVDKVIVFPRLQLTGKAGGRLSPGARSASLSRFISELRAEKFETVLDFHGILKSGLLALLSGAKERIGFRRDYTKEFNWLFINRAMVPPGHRISRFERNVSLVTYLDAAPSDLDVRISVPQEVKERIDTKLQPFNDSKPLVAIHPATSRPFKHWDTRNFARVADRLLTDEVAQVLITYGPGEEDVAKRVVSEMGPGGAPIVESASLREYAWLIKRADLYFGSDTGPMHIASAMGTPVVALFGPTDPAVNSPYRQPHRVLYRALPCSPCRERRCARNLECMTSITADEAYEAIVDMLHRTRAAR